MNFLLKEVGKLWGKWQWRKTISFRSSKNSFWKKSWQPPGMRPFYAYWVSRFLEYARRREWSGMEHQEFAVFVFGILFPSRKDTNVQP
jgi:hypothetical protein